MHHIFVRAAIECCKEHCDCSSSAQAAVHTIVVAESSHVRQNNAWVETSSTITLSLRANQRVLQKSARAAAQNSAQQYVIEFLRIYIIVHFR